jgi:hypothetical protein
LNLNLGSKRTRDTGADKRREGNSVGKRTAGISKVPKAASIIEIGSVNGGGEAEPTA